MLMKTLIAAAFALSAVVAQQPIPNRANDIAFGSSDAPIVLDAFVDLTCPDCKDAWPVLNQVMDHYGPNKLRLNFYPFPLPYHDNAFVAAQSAYAIQAQKGNVLGWLNSVYTNQSYLYNGATANLTKVEVVSAIADVLVSEKLITDRAAYLTSMSDVNINGITRTTWKYACSQGVSGTPSFKLNGVVVAADPTWTLANWQFILDPLLPATPSNLRSKIVLSSTSYGEDITCPTGQEKCQFLLGKFECCLAGENCIPNVGCRC